MTIESDAPIYDARAIAKQFITAAMVDLNAAREQAQAEYLADQAAMARLERSAATRRGWQARKRRLSGATSPTSESDEDF